jgi:hypothetical protein
MMPEVDASMYRDWKNWLELNSQSLTDTVLLLLSIVLLALLMGWAL